MPVDFALSDITEACEQIHKAARCITGAGLVDEGEPAAAAITAATQVWLEMRRESRKQRSMPVGTEIVVR